MDENYVYEAPMIDFDGGFLEVDCVGVQGDNMVLWSTDNEIVGDDDGVVNCDPVRFNRQLITSNYSSM